MGLRTCSLFCVNIELKVRSYVNRPIFIIRGIFTAVLVKSKTEVYEPASEGLKGDIHAKG